MEILKLHHIRILRYIRLAMNNSKRGHRLGYAVLGQKVWPKHAAHDKKKRSSGLGLKVSVALREMKEWGYVKMIDCQKCDYACLTDKGRKALIAHERRLKEWYKNDR